jgi:hypothetical protein
MRRILLTLIIFWTSVLFGQTPEKGIYRGQKTPFIICYLTYNDSTIEVEYFNQKSSQIFGHFPAKKLVYNTESFSTKPIFKSTDDSVLVYSKKNYYLVKRKGFNKIKVYKTADTQADISILRNRNKLFRFSHNLYDEFKVRPNFDQQQFWNKLNSYGLDKYVTLDNKEFIKKLNETRDDIKKNWL